ncbi:MAG: CPBP family intramembrane glutamic endopeptidase [Pseudomonadota bacterium]
MNTPVAYLAHEALVEPARPRAQIWRLLMGVILIAGVYLLCNRVVFQYLHQSMGEGADAFFDALHTGTTPLTLLLLLFSFGFMTVGVAVAARVVHLRGLGTVLGRVSLLRQQFVTVMIILILLNVAVLILPPWSIGEPLEMNMSASRWLMFLPFGLIAVLVQVSAEEILFRGYLQQQLAARFRSPLIWMVLPACLFGLGHYLPDDAGENAVLIAVWAAVFGMLMADLTARAGTLGPAIAIHLVNNVTAILFVSMPGELSGLSLYLSPFGMSDTEELRAWLPVDFAMMVVMWLAARLALRR